jgi:ABC-type transport system substrate-binding protein
MEYWDDPEDHIIKYAIPADLREPNIFEASSFYDKQWMYPVYGCLTKRAQISHFWESEIAFSSSTSVDLFSETQTINVTLHPDAKFSDGSPVLPEDVVYSYHLQMTPAAGPPNYAYLTYYLETNSSVIIDPSTGNVPGGGVIFDLRFINNFWEKLLNIPILDKSDVEPRIAARGWGILNIFPFDPSDTFNDGLALVKSCGPMMITDFNIVSSTVRLEPNPHWHGSPVQLSEFYLTFVSGKDTAISELASENIDIIDGQYYPLFSDFANYTNIEYVLIEYPNHQEMSINMKHPFLGTGELTPVGTPEAAKWIRKAISHATPRNFIVDSILDGLGFPATTPVPKASYGYDYTLEPYVYDINLAIDYMEDAGFSMEYTTIPTTTPTGPTTPKNYTIHTRVTPPEEEEPFSISYGGIGITLIMFIGVAIIPLLRRKRRNK